MKKSLIFITIISIFTIMLSSCKFSGLDSDTLLTPPQMNAADREILSVIESVTSSYKLIYPKTGGYQTAITSANIMGDDKSEAVCFYLDGNNNTVSLIILESINDVWTIRGKYDSRASGVERVNFCDLNDDGVKEIVIGWQFLSGEEKAIEILGFGSDTSMQSLYTGMYNNFIAFDDCIVVISRNTSGKTASASLIGHSKNSVSILNTVSLNNSITGFISVQSGQLPDSRRAIYIDEQLESLMYTTEVLIIEPNIELSRSLQSINTKTIRTRAYMCMDINGDKRLDIPVEKTFPEYIRNNVSEYIAYVEWYDYDGSSTNLITTAYTSINEQFMIELPEEWIGNITIQRTSDTERSVQFLYISPDNQLIPMFSIRVFSQQEYSDSIRNMGWAVIATSNENVYTFYSDQSELPEQFKIDITKITDLFNLLS